MSQAKSLGRRPVVALAAGALAGLLVIGTAGFAVMTSGTPSLADRLDTGSVLTGGDFVISGTATNSGSVDAANVVITGTIDTPALQGTLALGDVGAGKSAPYAVHVPIGAAKIGAYAFSTRAAWDQPSLDLKDDKYDAGIQAGRGVVVHTGSAHNSGKVAAIHVTVSFVATSDQAGQNRIGSGSQLIGDVAAGGDTPYKVSIDLGASPPAAWWSQYSFDYQLSTINTGQDSIQRVGGTLVLSGTVTNGGQAPARAITVSRVVVDAAGKELAGGQAPIPDLAPGRSAAYALTIDLGPAVVDEISGLGGRVAYTQTRFGFLSTRMVKPFKTTHWAV
jgi:hypothetical protein